MLKNQKYRLQVLLKLRPYVKGNEKLFWVKLFFGAALIGTAMINPVFYSIFIEETILKGNIRKLLTVIMGCVTVQLVNTAISYIRYYCTYILNSRISRGVRMEILDKRLKADFEKYGSINIESEKMLLDDAVFRLYDFTGAQSVDYFLSIGKTLALACIMFLMEWHLAAVMILTIPVSLFINSRNAKCSRENNEECWQNNKKWGNWIYASGISWREIRAWGMEDKCKAIFGEYSRRNQRLFRKYTQLWVTRRFVIPKIQDEFLMQFLLYFLGGMAIYYGYFSIGQLLIFGQYFLQLLGDLKSVVDADNELQINSVSYNRVLEALDEETPGERGGYKEASGYKIEIDHVTFRYKGASSDVLKDFSLTIDQGERIGIVGESGRGKTTLLYLMAGMLKPVQGEVRFGCLPLTEAKIQDVHKRIGFVFQEPLLFNASIKENLLYGKEDATDKEIAEACRKACISDFIESLPDRYDTDVGERGIKLSGGQKQRIVLARLFLQDVDVFILDEATSALDQNAESMIQNAVGSIGEEKTIIIVSHRENSLKFCQKLVYL